MKPQAISDLTFAFPANVVGTLLPERSEIPEEFDSNWHRNNHEWCGVANRWFSHGLDQSDFVAKDGIDAETAWKHLGTIMRSWEPKHEHKIAGVAWLMSQWFDKKAAATS
jgi:hypothetical protein